jgi:hypothetical protein
MLAHPPVERDDTHADQKRYEMLARKEIKPAVSVGMP